MAIRTIELAVTAPNPVLYPDTDRGTVVFTGGGKEPEQPKIIHAENVMATAKGLKSLSYAAFSTAALPAAPTFQHTQLLIVTNVSGNQGLYYCAGDPTVGHYVFNAASGSWVTVTTAADSNIITYPTTATLNGVNYSFKPNFGLFTFAASFASINIQTVLGITMTSMSGICNAVDYLITWFNDTVYWSAPGNPLDFRPIVSSIETGAGSSKIQELEGSIEKCVQIPGGFVIYSQKNAVFARYSGNSLNPWIFTEIENSSGLQFTNQPVGTGTTYSTHFVHSNVGIQEVGPDSATAVLPDVSAFLAGNKYTNSDHDGSFTKAVGVMFAVSIRLIANRYLCISYSTSNVAYYSHILIFDIAKKLWGSVVMDHYDTFDFQFLTNSSDLTSLLMAATGDLGIWCTNGHIRVIYLAFSDKTAAGVTMVPMNGEVIWSDFSLTYGKKCAVNAVYTPKDAEAGLVATLYDTPFRSGVLQPQVAFTETPSNTGRYVGDVTGESHRLRLYGKFDISAVFVDVVQLGKY